MDSSFHALNDYFDKIYVITLKRATNRQEIIKKNFAGLNYEFFYGVDKNTLDLENLKKNNIYSEDLAKKYNRYNKPMVLGHIACSLSHRKVYEDIVQNNYNNVLIFEDDAIPDLVNMHHIPAILAELPADWEILYWGYEKNETRGATGFLKQLFYHLIRKLGKIKWSHTMIKNLYARSYSSHLRKAGLHDLLHAYSITFSAAQKLIQLQTPIAFNADPAVSYAATNEIVKAFITVPIIFHQEIQLSPNTYYSYIHETSPA